MKFSPLSTTTAPLQKNWLKAIEKTFKRDKNIVGIVGRSKNMFPKNPYATAEQCRFSYWYLKHIISLGKEEILKMGKYKF